ncbi:hypothetical protein Poly30_53260 [Planctomycetes bacterium Poly30]|uniref:Protein BatD n=1 Tax=Saltatorellus ferox TaxID=2528018 RepID=A0A518F097_9BACT|nr:hypothetical protein Poly30_53260 [Planctomycetes bacterium Poly30]
MRFLTTVLLAVAAASTVGAALAQEPGEKIEFFRPTAPGAESKVKPVGETTVGMRVYLTELVIPGSAVQAKPVADPGRADALVRIQHEYTHGSGFRYDIEVTPFIEGTLDLRDYLERKDGTSLEDAPELPLTVDAMLEPDVLTPGDPEVQPPGQVGGYKKLMIGAGIAWFVGLLLLIFAFRRKAEPLVEGAGKHTLTLADRLRPLVEEARRSEISNERRAELERLLLAHWRRRRGLEDLPAAKAVTQLRHDDEAGPLFRQLEEWLHRPRGSADSAVDVSALLAPYENVAAEAPAAGGASRP